MKHLRLTPRAEIVVLFGEWPTDGSTEQWARLGIAGRRAVFAAMRARPGRALATALAGDA